MKIGGLQKLTLLDYPGVVACTVFTWGCNFRCPFCHNEDLVVSKGLLWEEEEVLAFLQKRKTVLDGICVSGGEPFLQPDLEGFLEKGKRMGYLMKLDTNGSFPERLEQVIREGLVDQVSMDIKNTPENYLKTCGLKKNSGEEQELLERIEKSVEILKKGRIPYEFRTTVTKTLHTPEGIETIAKWLAGAEAYVLQEFEDSGALVGDGMEAMEREELERACRLARIWIPEAGIRGE